MNWRPKLKCPVCGQIIPNTQFRPAGPITCPSCSRQLSVASWHLKLTTRVPIVLTLALCYFVGFRGFRYVIASVLLYFPVFLAWTFLLVRLIPPRFEPYEPKPAKAPNKPPTDQASHSSLDLFRH